MSSVIAAAADCPVPYYVMGIPWVDEPDIYFQSIKIDLQDFTPRKLICLAADTLKRLPARPNIEIDVFSSASVLEYMPIPWPGDREDPEPLSEDDPEIRILRVFHARLRLDSTKAVGYIEFLPAGVDGYFVPQRDYTTRIDLPAKTVPHCRIEFHDRCLLALMPIEYPRTNAAERPEGTVTIAARVTAAGDIFDARLVKSRVAPEGSQSEVVEKSLRNIASWHLEAARTTDTIEVTYVYTVDKSLARFEERVDWTAPATFTVRAAPRP